MTDGPDSQGKSPRPASDRSVEYLANKAIDLLARRRGAGATVLSERHLQSLSNCVLSRDEDQRQREIAKMQAAGVTLEEIVDHYIPEVARRLGEQWCADSLGFAEVTIGSARLQSLVRDLSIEFGYPPSKTEKPGVTVVVLADNFHTLGATILTTQLRRMGISVRLMMGVSYSEALNELSEDRYDAVMISASHTESLDNLAKFVKKIRRQTKRDIPIAIGGPVIGNAESNVRAVTGADVATSDVFEAIRACRLKTSFQDPTLITQDKD